MAADRGFAIAVHRSHRTRHALPLRRLRARGGSASSAASVTPEGLIDSKPHFNSVSNYLSDPTLTEVLKGLVTTSSLPLKAVETDFAVDASFAPNNVAYLPTRLGKG